MKKIFFISLLFFVNNCFGGIQIFHLLLNQEVKVEIEVRDELGNLTGKGLIPVIKFEKDSSEEEKLDFSDNGWDFVEEENELKADEEIKLATNGFLLPENSSYFDIYLNEKNAGRFTCKQLQENHIYIIMTKGDEDGLFLTLNEFGLKGTVRTIESVKLSK
ncbi:MAG: hypothetical protein ABIA74_03180 [bacterium]